MSAESSSNTLFRSRRRAALPPAAVQGGYCPLTPSDIAFTHLPGGAAIGDIDKRYEIVLCLSSVARPPDEGGEIRCPSFLDQKFIFRPLTPWVGLYGD